MPVTPRPTTLPGLPFDFAWIIKPYQFADQSFGSAPGIATITQSTSTQPGPGIAVAEPAPSQSREH